MFDDIPNIIEGVVDMHPGDKIICYTDGLSEAENPDQDELGTVPIEDCIASKHSISVIIENLKNQMKTFIKGQPVSDDISILGIEIC
jgi:serine phosphatase RsbU (regulator of sigma subunit)